MNAANFAADLMLLDALCNKYVAVNETKCICEENIRSHTKWFSGMIEEMDLELSFPDSLVSLYLEAAYVARAEAKRKEASP